MRDLTPRVYVTPPEDQLAYRRDGQDDQQYWRDDSRDDDQSNLVQNQDDIGGYLRRIDHNNDARYQNPEIIHSQYDRSNDLPYESVQSNPYHNNPFENPSANDLHANPSLTNVNANPFEEYSKSPSPDLLHNPFKSPHGSYERLNPFGEEPAPYDRYPSGVTNHSARVSTSSFDQHQSLQLIFSDASHQDPDHSPFGGFPADAFPLYLHQHEADDYLHNPNTELDEAYEKHRFMHDLKHMDRKSFAGMCAFVLLLLGSLTIFVVYPVLTYSGLLNKDTSVQTYLQLSKYTYPLILGIRTSLVDPDTPKEALTRKSVTGEMWPLVFSDEFNAEGRTFYPGDDQFFTAPDLNYAATVDLEWYDPDAVTTSNGTVSLRMDAFKNHDLFYRSGMLQSWNKMCFSDGILEVSVQLPNYGDKTGLWPGVWTMGNLGRPGYLATTEGVWPYTYSSCDAGITANQSSPDGISFLPGQRLNSCTCSGESHPNPGTGRGAVEVDVLEAEVSENLGRASQSLQVAPYDIWYYPDYDFLAIHNNTITVMNSYTGGPFQQAISATTALNLTWYERCGWGTNFQNYGFELNNEDGYLTWFVGMDPTFTIKSEALHPDGNIGWRYLPKEPLSIIMNLGISNSWAYIDWPLIHFPVTMRIDHVRVYQKKENLGCDPPNFPTYDYIQQHLNIYENNNITSFAKGGYTVPKNKLLGCK